MALMDAHSRIFKIIWIDVGVSINMELNNIQIVLFNTF